MKLLILGAGGHGKVVAEIAQAKKWDVAGFVDDDPEKLGETVLDDLEVVMLQKQLVEQFRAYDLDYALTFAFGNNAGRQKLRQFFAGVSVPRLIHPTATISPTATIGAGTQVSPQVVVHPLAEIGEVCILNTSCIIEHDCVIGDACHISPGAVIAGGVSVGQRTWIGANATVINNINIGQDVIVGAGSVVIRDLPDGVTAVGNPARIIKDDT